ncbi:MAG: CMD domain protein [Proteobacteria bacterium]|nr:CMD domain protein [Pseudomonadota bacterium]
MVADVIDTLADIAPGSALDTARNRRTVARQQAQASYLSLFKPASPGDFPLVERYAVAVFVAGLHGQVQAETFYGTGLSEAGGGTALKAAISMAVKAGRTEGPYGAFPKGPLSVEDKAGPLYRVAADLKAPLGPRLAAAFEHTHMLVFHPRDAAAPSLQALLDAGWSTDAVVTLSQLVAFLAFQIRVVSGLRVLATKV